MQIVIFPLAIFMMTSVLYIIDYDDQKSAEPTTIAKAIEEPCVRQRVTNYLAYNEPLTRKKLREMRYTCEQEQRAQALYIEKGKLLEAQRKVISQ